MSKKYDVNYLIQVVNYAIGEEDWCRMLLRKLPHGYISDIKSDDAYKLGQSKAQLDKAWDAVNVACELLGIDKAVLISVVKSMNRYEKRIRWESCVHIPNDESFRQFIADDFEAKCKLLYYPTTGRKRKQ